MEHFEAVRLLALREVVNARRAKPKDSDPDYPFRKVCREYSEAFSTPLHEVEALPIDYVLQHFFELRFEKLDELELREAVTEAIEDQEVLRLAQRKEDAQDYESFLDMRQIAAEEATKDLNVKPGKQEAAIRHGVSKEAELTAPKRLTVIPEGISMTFASDDDDSIGFGLFDEPKKR